MRSIAMWFAAVMIVGGLLSTSANSQGLANEPEAPSSSSEVSEGAGVSETGGSEAVPPVGEGQAGPPAEAGDVQERAVIRDHRVLPGGFTPSQTPPTPAPSGKAPLLMLPITPMTPAPAPVGQALPLPNYPTPTLNIAAVANAMRYDHKSLSTVVTVPPGLPLTQPVTISIGYFPSGVVGYGQYCQQRVTQTYASSNGNTFLCALPVMDGRQRRLHADITISEPKPGGGVYSYNVPVDMDLDPLYDITFGPLEFTLLNDCATLGDTHIKLGWKKPNRQLGEMDFTTSGGRMTVAPGFAWSAAEASLNKPLFQPELAFLSYGYSQYVGFEPSFGPGWTDDPHKTILAAGPIYTLTGNLIKGGLKALNDNFCSAYFEYKSTYTLRAYFGAPTVRDHR